MASYKRLAKVKARDKRRKEQVKHLTKRVDQLAAERDETYRHYLEARNETNDAFLQIRDLEAEVERLKQPRRRAKPRTAEKGEERG